MRVYVIHNISNTVSFYSIECALEIHFKMLVMLRESLVILYRFLFYYSDFVLLICLRALFGKYARLVTQLFYVFFVSPIMQPLSLRHIFQHSMIQGT
jgi:hypothetical protein